MPSGGSFRGRSLFPRCSIGCQALNTRSQPDELPPENWQTPLIGCRIGGLTLKQVEASIARRLVDSLNTFIRAQLTRLKFGCDNIMAIACASRVELLKLQSGNVGIQTQSAISIDTQSCSGSRDGLKPIASIHSFSHVRSFLTTICYVNNVAKAECSRTCIQGHF